MNPFTSRFIHSIGLSLLTLSLIGCATTPAPTSALPVEPAPEFSEEPCSTRAAVRVAPRYPREALKNHQNGWVISAVAYSADGRITSVKPVKASPAGVFEQATVDALSKWLLKTDGSGGSCMQLLNYELRP